ncbi:hypothetical protein Q31a_44720 [Aureliella helgolandensis]|uniref:Uncharacterized protein n=1 Tax=Aureliella helgolandensis TaxID=2527968 RepID=A0A518GC44_9BACT|nr:hypothetical protein Q31a_44720 [Aureliella helgolandensis]
MLGPLARLLSLLTRRAAMVKEDIQMHLTTDRLGDSQAFLIDGLGDSQRNPTRQRGRWTIQQMDCWSPGNFPPCLACLRGNYPCLRSGLQW